eukprot:TRINITY_DN18811_c0_g1_i1.p1 TRINITY_DN18811_c0_g1~~TRINITY_DN18811_c0_g1_i1.p1  ORF type:complete len:768 (+),score=132.58 TRINITY_DN18811_c0_g1_i1:65-2368(+)
MQRNHKAHEYSEQNSDGLQAAIVADHDYAKVILRSHSIGSLVFGKRVMSFLKRYYMKTIANAVFGFWVVTVMPSIVIFWTLDHPAAKIPFYIVGSITIFNQFVFSLFSQADILFMAARNIESVYLLMYLGIEIMSLLILLDYHKDAVFLIMVLLIPQLNYIYLDSMLSSNIRYKKAFQQIHKLRRQFGLHELQSLRERAFPPWNPKGLKDVTSLLKDPTFILNTPYLAEALNAFSKPDPCWPWKKRASFTIQCAWRTMSRAHVASCLAGSASKMIIYVLVVRRVIPFNDTTLEFFGFEVDLVELYRTSCAISIVVGIKRLVLLCKNPLQLTTLPRNALVIPVVRDWSRFLSAEKRQLFNALYSRFTHLRKDLKTAFIHSDEQSKNIKHVLPQSPNPSPDIEVEITGSSQEVRVSNPTPIIHRATYDEMIMIACSGSGELVNLSDQNVWDSKIKFHIPGLFTQNNGFIVAVTLVWHSSVCILIAVFLGVSDSSLIAALVGLVLSVLVILGYLSTCHREIAKRAFAEFGTAYMVINTLAMYFMWGFFVPKLTGAYSIICISLSLACLMGILIDAYPINQHTLANYLSHLSESRVESIHLKYEKILASKIAVLVLNKLLMISEKTSSGHHRRQTIAQDGIYTPKIDIISNDSQVSKESFDPIFYARIPFWQKLRSNRRFGLQRPIYFIIGALMIVFLHLSLETGTNFIEKDIEIYGISWNSRLLLRSFASNFIIFFTKKVLDSLFHPFVASSITRPLYLVPLSEDILEGF